MAPIINTSEKALKILDSAEEPYELVKIPKTEETPKPNELTKFNYQINPEDYILLEGKNSGKDSYPDLWICKYRLRADNDIKSAGKQLGLSIRNTAKEKNGRGYLGNINKEQALKLNLLLGGRTLNSRVGKDFFALLLSGKAFDGKGKKISKLELSQIADEIFRVRAPYRAEWFEEGFTGQRDNLTLNKNYVLQGDVLVSEYSHNLTTCLMEDRNPGIEFESWLTNSTAQGLPRKSVESGKVWYWHPRPDRAVRFVAGPDGASFICGRGPRSNGAWLGVRHVREAHAQKN